MPEGAEYVWIDGWDPSLNALVARFLGGNDGAILLSGGQALSAGYRQPEADVTRLGRSFRTWRLTALDAASALVGAKLDRELAALGLASSVCVAQILGIDVAQLDVVPDGQSPQDTLDTIVDCMWELLVAAPGELLDLGDELFDQLGAADAVRNELRGKLEEGVQRLSPIAKKIEQRVQIPARIWDEFFDRLAAGEIRLQLTGTAQATPGQPETPPTPRCGNGAEAILIVSNVDEFANTRSGPSLSDDIVWQAPLGQPLIWVFVGFPTSQTGADLMAQGVPCALVQRTNLQCSSAVDYTCSDTQADINVLIGHLRNDLNDYEIPTLANHPDFRQFAPGRVADFVAQCGSSHACASYHSVPGGTYRALSGLGDCYP